MAMFLLLVSLALVGLSLAAGADRKDGGP